MSRGGRGGGRGGRGGRRGPGGLDAENKFQISYDPRPIYPDMKIPPHIPGNADEDRIVELMIETQRRRREGPLYVPVAGKNIRVNKASATTATAKFDPFNGFATYSQKYHKAPRTAPDLSGQPWLKKYLPEELHWVVDSSVEKPDYMNSKKRVVKAPTNLNHIEDEEEDDEEATANKELIAEEQDENWEEDEDEDMDYEKDEKDDYNAEQYFDNGEDDKEFGGDEGGDYE